MRFFSGFSLQGEERYFRRWLKQSDFTVAGFSYGAVRAFEYALETPGRIDTLQLFSPAFFLDRSAAFKRLQLLGFERDADAYRAQFLANCFAPYAPEEVTVRHDGVEELRELLTYEWPTEKLKRLEAHGVRLEVYLGEKDAIVNAEAAKAHFLPYATTFLMKGANHFLQGDNSE